MSSTKANTISGNAPQEVKDRFSPDLVTFFAMNRFTSEPDSSSYIPLFGDSIMRRLVLTEVSINKKAEEPTRSEARVVCEIDVQEDMVNGAAAVHGGCAAYLIDICTSMALFTLRTAETGTPFFGVSQSLSVVYHSPASLGDKLRIVNTTMTTGSRALSARTEIWNVTHRRLVTSGVHIKMKPSEAKAKL